jgi:KUP system potassium uptake protein
MSTIATLGVVYGDIGMSPLYALREALGENGVLPLTERSVLGVLSLIFWSLIVLQAAPSPRRRDRHSGRDLAMTIAPNPSIGSGARTRAQHPTVRMKPCAAFA